MDNEKNKLMKSITMGGQIATGSSIGPDNNENVNNNIDNSTTNQYQSKGGGVDPPIKRRRIDAGDGTNNAVLTDPPNTTNYASTTGSNSNNTPDGAKKSGPQNTPNSMTANGPLNTANGARTNTPPNTPTAAGATGLPNTFNYARAIGLPTTANGARVTGLVNTPNGARATIPIVQNDPQPGPSHTQPDVDPRFAKIPEFQTLTKDQQRVFGFIVDMYPDVGIPWLTELLRGGYHYNPDQLVYDLIAGNRAVVKNVNDDEPSTSTTHHSGQGTANGTTRKGFTVLDAQGRFSPKEFLDMFPEPLAHFNETATRPDFRYQSNAIIELKKAFPYIHVTVLMQQLKRVNFHYYPAATAIRALMEKYPKDRYRWGVDPTLYLKSGKRRYYPPVQIVDDKLHYELIFWKYEESINKFITDREAERTEALANARALNLLRTCGTCYDDECLPDQMLSCDAGEHRYCIDCISNHAKVAIAERRPYVGCMSEECESVYADRVLRRILSQQDFDAFDDIRVNVHVKQAGLENLETCEFCDFKVIMPNKEDKVVKCLNRKCRKETCRLCRKKNHVPLSCKEAADDTPETKFRTFIENRMAEALIRNCPKCSNRIVKTTGCNKMTCSCGASMCYVCRALLDPMNPYKHYQEEFLQFGKKCPLHTKDNVVHDDMVIKAGNAAKEEFLAQNPEIASLIREKNITVDVKTLAKK